MEDIVEQLRRRHPRWTALSWTTQTLEWEAADEIERLRNQLRLTQDLRNWKFTGSFPAPT